MTNEAGSRHQGRDWHRDTIQPHQAVGDKKLNGLTLGRVLSPQPPLSTLNSDYCSPCPWPMIAHWDVRWQAYSRGHEYQQQTLSQDSGLIMANNAGLCIEMCHIWTYYTHAVTFIPRYSSSVTFEHLRACYCQYLEIVILCYLHRGWV